MTTHAIRSYCIRKNLFTSGSNNQYSKMLEYADNNPHNWREVATMIWICSNTWMTLEQFITDFKLCCK